MYLIEPIRLGNERSQVVDSLGLDYYFSTTLTDTIRESIFSSLNVEEGEEEHTLITAWVEAILDSLYAMLNVFGYIEFNFTRSTICRHSSDEPESYVKITKGYYGTDDS